MTPGMSSLVMFYLSRKNWSKTVSPPVPAAAVSRLRGGAPSGAPERPQTPSTGRSLRSSTGPRGALHPLAVPSDASSTASRSASPLGRRRAAVRDVVGGAGSEQGAVGWGNENHSNATLKFQRCQKRHFQDSSPVTLKKTSLQGKD